MKLLRNTHPLQVTDLATASANENSKLTRYATVLLGCDPGEDLQTEDLVGLCCQLRTEQKTNRKGQSYARVIERKPLPAGEKGPAIPLNFTRAENRPHTTQSSAPPRPEARPN
jgi:hypothetical protein